MVNYRMGALVAISSIAFSLDTNCVDYFPLFLEQVLKCLEDSDNKVRYYTSETLYNIAKAANTRILRYFDQFLYAACQLFADDDTDVKKISFINTICSFLHYTELLYSIVVSRRSFPKVRM